MITVVSTALNAKPFAARCIQSVQRQTIAAPHVYVDAASEDGTSDEARRVGDRLLDVRTNVERRPCLQNLYDAIRDLPPDEIVVWLDGDDWLAHDRALERVAREYDAGDVWTTFGQFAWFDGRKGFAERHPGDVIAKGAYRSVHWRATHLKSFRAGIFQAIPLAYLQEASGEWFAFGCDQALMFPILEMAAERQRFIPDVLYVYNDPHSFEEHASPQKRAVALEVVARIRARAPLARLSAKPWG